MPAPDRKARPSSRASSLIGPRLHPLRLILMPAFCLDCGTYVERGNRCPDHAAAHARRVELRRADDEHRQSRRAIYRDARWKQARQVALANAAHRCERCGRPDSVGAPLSVHHAHGYVDPFNPDQLEVLCPSCHGREDGGRARATGRAVFRTAQQYPAASHFSARGVFSPEGSA